MNPFSSPYQQPTYGAGVYPNYPQINYTQPPFRHILPGKSVNNLDEISPDDVPSDGSFAVFPKSDASCIYVKYRNSLGIITTETYVPKETEEEIPEITDPSDVTMTEISDKLNTVIDLLNKRPKYYHNKNYKKKANQNGSEKEVTEHDA